MIDGDMELDRWRTWWAAASHFAGTGWEHGVLRHLAEYGGYWPEKDASDGNDVAVGGNALEVHELRDADHSKLD